MANKSRLQTGYLEFSFPLLSNEAEYHRGQEVSRVNETCLGMEALLQMWRDREEGTVVRPLNH